MTGLDAVRYFCSGAGKPGDLIYCNLAHPLQHSNDNTVVGHNNRSSNSNSAQQPDSSAGLLAAPGTSDEPGFCGDNYNPYDLTAVPQQQVNRLAHWVVSYHGVTQMRCARTGCAAATSCAAGWHVLLLHVILT